MSTAAAVLSLPSIAPEVPTGYSEVLPESLLRFGQVLHGRGCLQDRPKVPLDQLIEQGVESLVPTDSGFACELYVCESDDEYSEIPDGQICLDWTCDLDSMSEVVLTPLLAVRQRNPALAHLALRVLESVSRLFPIITPLEFLSLTSYHEWMGESDEELAIQEMLDQDVPLDEIDVVRKADVYREVPKWSVLAGQKRGRYLWSRAIRHAHEEDHALLRDLWQLQNDLTQALATAPGLTLEPLFGALFLGCLTFRPLETRTLYYRILNIHFQNLMEMGEDKFLLRVSSEDDGAAALDALPALQRLLHGLYGVLNQIGEMQ